MTSFSLSAFRDFCAAKPEGEEYEYLDADNCAMGQFEKANGRFPASNYYSGDERTGQREARLKPRTFGALTARLDALIEGEKK